MSDPKKTRSRAKGKGGKSNVPWGQRRMEQLQIRGAAEVSEESLENKEFKLDQTNFPPLPTQSSAGDSGNQDGTESSIDQEISIGQQEQRENMPQTGVEQNSVEQISLSATEEDNKSEEVESQRKENDPTPKESENKQSLTSSINVDTTACNNVVSNLSPYAEEFVPRNDPFRYLQSENLNQSYVNNRLGIEEHSIDEKTRLLGMMNEIDETISFFFTKLIEAPGSFDELMEILLPHFKIYLRHPQLASKIALDIFNYALTDSIFSYLAVKMLVCLIGISSSLNSNSTIIRDTLLNRAREEVRITKEVKLLDPSAPRIQPFLLFLSELYIQLKVGGGRLVFLGEAVIEVLEKYLFAEHIPIKERLQLIVNTVKLTGIYLDEDKKSILDQFIMTLQLKLAFERHNLDDSTTNAVSSLISLRDSGWGDLDDATEQDATDLGFAQNGHGLDEYPTEEDNMAVFYGPDGNVMPYEEQMFLESNAMGQENEPSPGGSMMDGEMEEAYDEFLLSIPERREREVPLEDDRQDVNVLQIIMILLILTMTRVVTERNRRI